jgi:Winged helix-turn helix
MGDLGDVVAEGANIDLFAEACLLGFGFKSLDFVTNALVGSAACPFWLGREWLVDVWQAAALKTLGFSHVSARPKAYKQNAEAMDAFKKTSPSVWRKSARSSHPAHR